MVYTALGKTKAQSSMPSRVLRSEKTFHAQSLFRMTVTLIFFLVFTFIEFKFLVPMDSTETYMLFSVLLIFPVINF